MEKPVNGAAALKLILDGCILESDERYYRYNTQENLIEWSDDLEAWKESSIAINQLLKADWNKAL